MVSELNDSGATIAPVVQRPLTSPHIRHASADRQRQIKLIPNEVNHTSPDHASGGFLKKYRQPFHTQIPTEPIRQRDSEASKILSFKALSQVSFRPNPGHPNLRSKQPRSAVAPTAAVAPATVGASPVTPRADL